ncbi:hypothetical protein DFJ73DRAFT_184393 [Zopfochytrium polystomum]|nr:hypothetical protein DFJ73DRAFT_184393 [Zopfochytrium polystomum]
MRTATRAAPLLMKPTERIEPDGGEPALPAFWSPRDPAEQPLLALKDARDLHRSRKEYRFGRLALATVGLTLLSLAACLLIAMGSQSLECWLNPRTSSFCHQPPTSSSKQDITISPDIDQVWAIDIADERAAHAARALLKEPDSLSEVNPPLDFWNTPVAGAPLLVRVRPTQKASLISTLQAQNLTFSVAISDVPAAARAQLIPAPPTVGPAAGGKNSTAALPKKLAAHFRRYQPAAAVRGFLQLLAAEFPGVAEVERVGKTAEGRTIEALRIRVRGDADSITAAAVAPAAGSETKREIVLMAGMHAREWIGPAVVQYVAASLLAKYEVRKKAKRVLDAFDFVVLPVANVDGYVYSHEVDRLWRKNRQHNEGTTCVGVDMDRNWDTYFGGAGSSANPCSESFRGKSPFSTPEAKAISTYLRKKAANIVSLIDFHAFSQLWMYPSGGDCDKSVSKPVQLGAKEAVKAIKSVYGKKFGIGTVCDLVYASSGASIDWASEEAKIPFAYSVELRDRGRHGFLLPTKHILPSGEEAFEAVLAVADFILSQN